MPEKVYIGNFGKGLTKDRLPFVIDNDAFPTMYNFYTWRGRAKRKRGTVPLARLQRQLQSVASGPNQWQVGPIMTLSGAGAGSANLISLFILGSTAQIVPNSFTLTDGTNTYTEPATANGTLTGSPGGSGTINYATGAITITGGAAAGVLRGTFSYYPDLPVMGLRDFVTSSSTYPLLLSFDTKYSYQITSNSASFYSTSYYKNSNNPVVWSGQNYQQFWTTNYSGALWATNGKAGFNFQNIATISVGNPTTITTSSPHNLVTEDYVFFNEITGADASSLNLQAFSITKTGASSFTVAVDTTTKTINNSGIFQTLTAGSNDGIKWYDGDPTSGTGLPTSTGLGWVNFAPPLTATTVSIDNVTAAKYYLVGAVAILPFKDRILFFGPTIQTSSGSPIYLQDTVIWSWNGTPYYNSLTPSGETYDATAYYVDQTGKGGYLAAGIAQAIVTVNTNEDVILVGFSSKQTRFVYTGNDLFPFLFYSINSEFGANSTFSGITLDRGALTYGSYGIALTAQDTSQRIDLQIPDEAFQIKATNNGAQRINAGRDFFKEWIYFSYPPNNSQWSFPTQTFFYNYREGTWGVFYENFTSHGQYRRQTGYTWATIPFRTWATWRETWNSSTTTALFPSVVAGNPQGFVVIKGEGTGEAPTGYISAIQTSSGNTQITSNDHCVKVGDYLYFASCIGNTYLNSQIGKVISTADANTFVVDIAYSAGTYLGLGTFTRLSQPLLQTKQFPIFWDQGKQVRLGVQKYLLDYTDDSQVTLNIYLSQDPDDAWNSGTLVPDLTSVNNSLVYSDVLFTCPEPNNLQMPTASGQYQIWHRMNTSLIGDTFQIGITLSDAQMRNLTYATSEITLHAMVLDVSQGPDLA